MPDDLLTPSALAAVLDALSAHVVLLDADGVIRAANRAWTRFHAENGGDGSGCGVGSSYLAACEAAEGEDAAEGWVVAFGIRQVLAGREAEFVFEYPCHAPGEERWFRMRVVPVAVGTGRGAVVAHEPVTDRVVAARERALAAELGRARVEAERASRSKSEFLSSMSHELRTPLNSVIGFTGVLRKNRGGGLRPQDLLMVERIHANGLHLLELVNGVLDLAKIEAGKLEVERGPVALDSLVRETLEELQGNVRPGVRLSPVLPPRAVPVETDGRKLKQVLINLVGNSLKFTEAGSVEVRLEVEPEGGRPTRLEVRDTGIGIPADRLDRIFEAFEQGENGTARRFAGTGLGLAISASLARLLGYRIEVESEPGRGSTFRLELAA